MAAQSRFLRVVLTLGCLFVTQFPVFAQTVQLPTTRQFWSTGGVLVPDRGGVSMAGAGHRSTRRSARSFPPIGNARLHPSVTSGHRGSSVHATIIDLQAMDRSVLAAARKDRTKSLSPEQERAQFIAQNVFRRSRQKTESPRRTKSRDFDQRIATMITKGKQAELDGKPKVAQMFFRAAAQLRMERNRF